jgi:hypothetical protein
VWTGATGTRDERGVQRDAKRLADLWGVLLPVADGGSVPVSRPPLSRVRVGSGELLLLPGDWGLGPFRGDLTADRWQAEPVRAPFPALLPEESSRRLEVTTFLAGLLPEGPDLSIRGFPADVIATVTVTEDGASLVVHLVNAAGCLDVLPEATAGHADEIPCPILEPGLAALEIRVPDRLAGASVRSVLCLRPPSPEAPVSLAHRMRDRRVEVDFPRELLRCSCLIEVDIAGDRA